MMSLLSNIGLMEVTDTSVAAYFVYNIWVSNFFGAGQ